MTSLSSPSQAKLKRFFQLGLQRGCPHDQLLNFTRAGLILQDRQLAASAAARLCDQPNGPKAIGYGGSGTNRFVTLTPASNQNGVSTITLTVSDGTLAATSSFAVTVLPPSIPPAFPPKAISRRPDGSRTMAGTAEVGMPYRLWATTNLTFAPGVGAWDFLTNGVVTGSPFTFVSERHQSTTPVLSFQHAMNPNAEVGGMGGSLPCTCLTRLQHFDFGVRPECVVTCFRDMTAALTTLF